MEALVSLQHYRAQDSAFERCGSNLSTSVVKETSSSNWRHAMFVNVGLMKTHSPYDLPRASSVKTTRLSKHTCHLELCTFKARIQYGES